LRSQSRVFQQPGVSQMQDRIGELLAFDETRIGRDPAPKNCTA
jgi:hypothetical protein